MFLDIHIKHLGKAKPPNKADHSLEPSGSSSFDLGKKFDLVIGTSTTNYSYVTKTFSISFFLPPQSPSYKQHPLILPILTWVTILIFHKCHDLYHLPLELHKHCHLPHPIAGSLQVLH